MNILSVSEMRKILPVKPDFLMLDRAQVVNENKLIGGKGVTMDEPCFLGHFPGHPILPGVLQCEAVAQLAEIGVRDRLDPNHDRDIYIKKISNVKFRKPNNPGDRIRIEADILSVENGEAAVSAVLYNNAGESSSGSFVLAVRDKVKSIPPPADFNEFDKSADSLMDVNKIMDVIPHRLPFLFVDSVAKIDDSAIYGVKNATNTEAIFREYPDGYMVMTGSVQPEIIAQAGCIHVLTNEAMKGKIAYFMGIESAEFFAPIFPGDQMVMKMKMPPGTRRAGKGVGEMIVDGKVVMKLVMSYMLVDR